MDLKKRILTISVGDSKRLTFPDHYSSHIIQVLNSLQLAPPNVISDTGYWIELNLSEIIDQAPNTVLSPAIQQLLTDFADVFEEPKSLPPERIYDHKIPLKTDSTMPNIRPYRIPHKQKDEAEKLIKELLQTNFIRPSSSPYSSPLLLVRNKDHTWRVCIDYRWFNSQTIKNKFPIPVIEDLLVELFGAKVFTKLDLRSSYYQIRMHPSDIHKTAFKTYFGHYEFIVMPFWLTNALATFQALMNETFGPYLRKFVLVFFNDILIYSQNEEDHIEHLKIVLNLLRTNSLSTKRSKCTFAVPHVDYLGYIIGANGVSTDLSKISTIIAWPQPKSVTELRDFLGIYGYYRRFIKDFGIICKPLHDMLKKESFHWTELQTKAFNLLKHKMTSAHVLAFPDFSKPFIL
jgi:hypothetical protein